MSTDSTGQDFPPDFTVEPYTENCRRICADARHILIGVSPGNGYFSERRLTALVRWAAEGFEEVDVIVPDVSLVHTYRALGQGPAQARVTAGSATRRMCRRIARAWEASGVPAPRHRVRVLSEFLEHPRYQELLRHTEAAVAHDAAVREVFLEASGKALGGHLKDTPPTAAQLEEGMRYLIAEMPLCTDTPGILGVPSSVHVYHRLIPTVPLVFGALFASAQQAFALVRPAEQPQTGDGGTRFAVPDQRPRGGGHSVPSLSRGTVVGGPSGEGAA